MSRLKHELKNMSPWWISTFLALVAKQLLFGALIGFGIIRIKTQLITVLGSTFIMLAFCWLLSRRKSPWLALTLSGFLGLILLANAIYTRQFHAPMSLLSGGQTSNLDGLWESVMGLTTPWDLLLIIDVPLLALWRIKRTLNTRRQSNPENLTIFQRSLRYRMVAVLAFLLFGVTAHIAAATKDILVQHRKPFELNFDNLENIVRLSTPFYYLLEARNLWLEPTVPKLTSRERIAILTWNREQQARAHSATLRPNAPPFAIGKGKSLVMIQVEALESSVANARMGGMEITPTLNALLRSEISFTNLRSQVAHGNTADAELATLAAWNPLRQGAAFFRFPQAHLKALPGILAEHGYNTLAYHGNRASFWNRGPVFRSIGFSKFRSLENLPAGPIMGMGLDDRVLFHEVLSDLTQMSEPIFSFVITISSHQPYLIPPEKVEPAFAQAVPKDMIGDYMISLHYADVALGEFIADMKRKGIWDNAIVFIYGDHEGIPSHLRTEALPESIRSAALSNDRRVPAVLHIPGMKPTQFTHLVGQIDVMPTLLHVLGVEEHSEADVHFGANAFLNVPRALLFAAESKVIRDEGAPEEEKKMQELTFSQRLLETCSQRPTCGDLREEN